MTDFAINGISDIITYFKKPKNHIDADPKHISKNEYK